MKRITVDDLEMVPLTPATWDDFEELFGPNGACGGCWCMWWRSTRREMEERKSEGNRRAMKKLVDSDVVPGLIAYRGAEACGWCSVAPREHYASLERSPVIKRIDDRPVWSIVCFFVTRRFRGEGFTGKLIQGALEYVRSNGGSIVEAYPTPPRGRKLSPLSSFMGVPSVFERAGFERVLQPSPSRLIMRRHL